MVSKRRAALRNLVRWIVAGASLCWLAPVAPLHARGDDDLGDAAPTKTPFDRQAYKIRVLVSFANDARLTPRLRADVLRRFRTHASAFVGDAWQLELTDVSGTLGINSGDTMSSLTSDRIAAYLEGQDKVFVLGIRSTGDRFVVAVREYDVFFSRWGPIFFGSAQESTQLARELLVLAGRMFSPLARLEAGDAKKVSALIKGGSLPTLNPDAVDPRSKYQPSFQFVPTRTLFRPMQPVFNEDRTEIIGMAPKQWTFYVVEARDGPLAICQVDSAMRNVLPPQLEDPNDPQLIVARTASGSTSLRLVDNDNLAPLPAMDVEVVETVGGASIPLGTTDSDGRIDILPNRTGPGLVWVYIRHGRDTMARLPILPGAGEEPDLAIRPDAVRLDIEGRVMAVQAQIVDQVARRTILGGHRDRVTNTMQGGLIRKAIDKKDWTQSEALLKQLKESPTGEVMTGRLNDAKEYARSQRPEEKWTAKIKKLFGETEQIIDAYFNVDDFTEIVDELEEDLKIHKEEAAAEAAAQTSGVAPADSSGKDGEHSSAGS